MNFYIYQEGPRQPGTNAIPGGPIRDENGEALDYDIEAQTQAVIDNVRVILEAAGSSLDQVIDITVFLVDMDRDFKGYNKVYKNTFEPIQATRTTVAITALPTPIAVEFRCSPWLNARVAQLKSCWWFNVEPLTAGNPSSCNPAFPNSPLRIEGLPGGLVAGSSSASLARPLIQIATLAVSTYPRMVCTTGAPGSI